MIRIVKPEKYSTVSLLTQKQVAFINGAEMRANAQGQKFDYLNLVVEGEDETAPEPVRFLWESDSDDGEYVLEIADDEDFDSKIEIHTTQPKADIYNLQLGKKYYARVCCKTECSDVTAFCTAMETPRSIYVPGLVNVRDFGGWKTSSGKRINQGLLYRGCKMNLCAKNMPPQITDEGKRVMVQQLEIKTDIDLRADSIEKGRTGVLDEYGVRYMILPCNAYEEFLWDRCSEGNRRIFEELANEDNYPIYLHCWGGADRTNMIMFMLGAILGMSEEDMLLDYEYTSLAIWGIRTRNSEGLQNFKKSLSKFGPIDNWLDNALQYLYSIGVTDEVMDKIRKIFLP